MRVLDVLRERGYVPQDGAKAGEDWFDNPFGMARVRVILTDSEWGVYVLTGPVGVWAVRSVAAVPFGAFLDILDAAEREAGAAGGLLTSATIGRPQCNHDPAGVRDGICKCGEIVGPCTGCGGRHGPPVTEVNYEATCAACAEEYGEEGDHLTLDMIAQVLRAGGTTDVGLREKITALVAGTGRDVGSR